MKFLADDRQSVNKATSVPAPTGGINVRDSLANMPETDAITMINWWPEPQGCRVRRGSSAWTLDIPQGSGALATWDSGTGESKLFTFGTVGDEVAIYDISNKQLVTDSMPTPAYTGLDNPTPNTTQMVNDAGAHLFFISGNGGAIAVYDSTGFHEILFSAAPPPATPVDYTWYGGLGANTNQMAVHQGHLWATDSQSSVAWYLPVDAVWGEWKPFDFGPQMTLGGGVHTIATWTIDDGNGAEDHLVVITNRGQAVVYGGTDPSSIATWSLVGVYTIGNPVGLPGRYIEKVGGDLVVLTQSGLVSMSSQLVSSKVNSAVNPINSAKIQLIISRIASISPHHKDWQLQYCAADNLFIINVPPIHDYMQTGQRQLAVNLVTDACPWTMFNNIDAAHWTIYGHRPYYGTSDGRIYHGWDGWTDEAPLDGTAGRDIRTQVQQAYTYFRAPAIQKQVGMFRPTFIVSEEIAYGAGIEYDFLIRRLGVPSAGRGVEGTGTWADASDPRASDGIWDQVAWAGGLFPYRHWVQAQGIGSAVSLRLAMDAHSDILWVSTDYSYKTGTLL